MTRANIVRALVAVVVVASAVALVWFVVLPARTPTVSPTEFVPQSWELARTTPMHVAHVGKKNIACARCHAQGVEKAPNLGVCAESDCHANAAANAHRGSATTKTDCLTCHVFKGGARASACVDCHGASATTAGSPRLVHHATKDVRCTDCHALHAEKGTRSRAGDCTQCHENTRATHGTLIAGGPDAGTGDGHASSMCTSCHLPHQGKDAAVARCSSCHVAREVASAPHVEPRGRRVAGHEACLTCHVGHDARKADVRACAGCHADHATALMRRGHTTCRSCHAPHAPGAAGASCAACHGAKNTLASARVPAHASCESCHDPHRPTARKEAACVSCHTTVSPKHPQDRACIGCHAPHPASPEAPIAATCSSCHTKAKSDRGFHAPATSCVQCHVPHAFALGSGRSRPASMASTVGASFCSRCHAPETQATSTRPGHAQCVACHGEPHTPVKSPSCAACHEGETRTAPKGHSTCTSCHQAHDGSLGANATCTLCHGNKKNAQHGNLATGCATCHRPHGPKGIATPPPCTSCHEAGKLPGLHSVPAHAATCTTCHTAHRPPSSERATCTTGCHADRKTHQPEATVCKGCHIFAR